MYIYIYIYIYIKLQYCNYTYLQFNNTAIVYICNLVTYENINLDIMTQQLPYMTHIFHIWLKSWILGVFITVT